MKQCSVCNEIKEENKYYTRSNICKVCSNLRKKTKYNAINTLLEKECNICLITKSSEQFIRNRIICKDCNNAMRRNKYQTDLEHRTKLINMALTFKHNKVVKKRELKQIESIKLSEEIGIENAICKYCKDIKPKSSFRKNRLKCKDCERDVPIEKFKRAIRCRIYCSLIRKTNRTIEYLGCNTPDYIQWISYNTSEYNIENHGKIWHIDHVIPLSTFNLADVEEQYVAFNWRNTMALSKQENLSKNNKIIISQITTHYNNLIEYHNKYNIIMPQKYIDLFAKHLDAGSPLEPMLSNK